MKINKTLMENTGLVIVHPFLPQLFKYLDYLDETDQFKNEELRCRAVHLLHYIVTGQENDSNEADLAMSKVLAGMLIEDPIPLDLILSEEEKNYGNEMLQAIISKWKKLGSTSNDGLRNTFLKRNGILEEENKDFQLTIETSGTDILLDYIPWNTSIIN